jgi:hypothetical protein
MDNCVRCKENQTGDIYFKRQGCVCHVKWCPDFYCVKELFTMSRFIKACSYCKVDCNDIEVYENQTLKFVVTLKDQWYFKPKTQVVAPKKEEFIINDNEETETFLPRAPTVVLETNIACYLCNEITADLLECAMCQRYRIHLQCLGPDAITQAVWYCGNCWESYNLNREKHLCLVDRKEPVLGAFKKLETKS